jgi:hypothetical protein
MMMEAIHSSETSDPTRGTWHNIPEDGILQDSHCASLDNNQACLKYMTKALSLEPTCLAINAPALTATVISVCTLKSK